MVDLCRHIMPSNRQCESPALKGQRFCFNHQRARTATRRRPRSPNDFTYVIPFIYPEDRAAINHNLFLVLQAQAEHKIDTRTANSMTANLRAAAININRGPLLEENHANAVQRVILTPEGDEIAPPRELLEEGESAPLHHKNCPCQRCAEEFRNAPPEQHHADCKCGLCYAASDQPLTNGCHSERSETQWSEVEGLALSLPKGPAVSQSATNADGAERQSRTARATKLHVPHLTTDCVNEEANFFNYIYREQIEKHEAQYAARARAAIEAGLEPPPYEPFDPKKRESESARRHKENIARIEKNREIGREIWNRRYPDQAVEYTPYLSWGDQQDLKLAHMKKLREEEQERSRAASDAPMADVSLPAS